ncbi:hypothetical protein [Paenibacillus aestuarii]|uniref:Uncharacterized protein n=1 Tax=Paenibacillus aestuarii TaxID=516965 RepID=A0ABW0K339_9BACL|nr:hypothetical protein [Paenibacillus aestuarii]
MENVLEYAADQPNLPPMHGFEEVHETPRKKLSLKYLVTLIDGLQEENRRLLGRVAELEMQIASLCSSQKETATTAVSVDKEQRKQDYMSGASMMPMDMSLALAADHADEKLSLEKLAQLVIEHHDPMQEETALVVQAAPLMPRSKRHAVVKESFWHKLFSRPLFGRL